MVPDQPFLMPPNPSEWLPEDHLARFVLELIRELDIAAIEAPPAEQARVSRRAEGREAAARALDPDGARRAAVHHPKATRGGAPQASAQRNFTDPASRMMEGGGGFTQAYNGHIAVDDEWHVIVGQGDSNQAPDTQYFIPMLERVQSTELH